METVLSTAFFPPIAYMAHIAQNQSICIDLGEHYVKQNLRNRCQLYAANGPIDLVVPLYHGRSPGQWTHSMRIAYADNWPVRHWRSVEAAYRSSPYFEYYADRFRPFFDTRYELLWQYNQAILQTLTELLGLNTPIRYTQQYVEHPQAQTTRMLTHKHRPSYHQAPTYWQVFGNRHGFRPNLSVLDLIFCEGPQARAYLMLPFWMQGK